MVTPPTSLMSHVAAAQGLGLNSVAGPNSSAAAAAAAMHLASQSLNLVVPPAPNGQLPLAAHSGPNSSGAGMRNSQGLMPPHSVAPTSRSSSGSRPEISRNSAPLASVINLTSSAGGAKDDPVNARPSSVGNSSNNNGGRSVGVVENTVQDLSREPRSAHEVAAPSAVIVSSGRLQPEQGLDMVKPRNTSDSVPMKQGNNGWPEEQQQQQQLQQRHNGQATRDPPTEGNGDRMAEVAKVSSDEDKQQRKSPSDKPTNGTTASGEELKDNVTANDALTRLPPTASESPQSVQVGAVAEKGDYTEPVSADVVPADTGKRGTVGGEDEDQRVDKDAGEKNVADEKGGEGAKELATEKDNGERGDEVDDQELATKTTEGYKNGVGVIDKNIAEGGVAGKEAATEDNDPSPEDKGRQSDDTARETPTSTAATTKVDANDVPTTSATVVTAR